ncbi:EcsC family protein [Nocardioides mesophilus]|uniref:EcsC family protein n=1 Tax=Nocardioides mesophilus TaxID=433659 RepID=A0A7G9RFY3_9ACTN|nr:EcsC family protein [Nocardioides mesophilus]QNN54508.1 EcsC family protein [Nocardioides mesophilus]
MGIGSMIGKTVAPRVHRLAPDMTSGFVHEALNRAISGAGPLPPAARAAEQQLAEQKGDRQSAVHEVIENHVRYAGAQGFATNLGGLVTAAVMIPANVTGLALIQCRMVAGIAHLRDYDLEDPRVRNAILACILGEDSVKSLVRRKKLPAPPMALATAPTHDPDLNRIMAGEVASELLTKVAGKRMAVVIGRRVPVVGGLVGASADGFATWQIGRYADRELLARTRR